MYTQPRKRGVIFVIAIVALAVMLTLGISLVGVTTHQLGNAKRLLNDVHAIAMADAGLNLLIWRQKWGKTDGSLNPITPKTLPTGYNLHGVTTDKSPSVAPVIEEWPMFMPDGAPTGDRLSVWLFDYSVNGTNGYQVISQGKYRGYTRMVRAILQGAGSGSTGGSNPPPVTPPAPIFNQALFSGGNLTLSGNANVTGSVGTNGNFTASGNMSISQDINAAGSVKISGNNVLVGNTIHYGTTFTGKTGYTKAKDGTVFPFPSIDVNAWKTAAINSGAVINGNLNISGKQNFNKPIVYVKGDVTFSGQSSIVGKTTLVVEGSVHFSGQLASDPAPPSTKSNIVIMATNGVQFTGQTTVNATIYAHNVTQTGSFQGSGQATVYGAIIADTISGSGQFTIYYRTPDTYTQPPTDPGGGGGGSTSAYQWNVASWEPL